MERLFSLIEAEASLQTLIADDAAAGGDDDIVKDLGLEDLRRIALMRRPAGEEITKTDRGYRTLIVDELSFELRVGREDRGGDYWAADRRTPIRRAAWDQPAEEWVRIESAIVEWAQAKA